MEIISKENEMLNIKLSERNTSITQTLFMQ